MVIINMLDNLTLKLAVYLYVLPPNIDAGHTGQPSLLPSGEGAFNRIIIYKEFATPGNHDIIQEDHVIEGF